MSRLDPIVEARAVATLLDSIKAVAGEDETLAIDMIEGETSLFEALDLLLGRMRETAVMVEGLKVVEGDLRTRRSRMEGRIATDRTLIEQALLIADLKTLERPTATLSLANRPPRIEVQTEAEIPSRYWRQGDPVLDRKALLEDLKSGEAVPGACLSNAAPSLTIRVK